MSGTRMVSMTVNGEAVSRAIEPRRNLVDFLREDLQLTGTHGLNCQQRVIERAEARTGNEHDLRAHRHQPICLRRRWIERERHQQAAGKLHEQLAVRMCGSMLL